MVSVLLHFIFVPSNLTRYNTVLTQKRHQISYHGSVIHFPEGDDHQSDIDQVVSIPMLVGEGLQDILN